MLFALGTSPSVVHAAFLQFIDSSEFFAHHGIRLGVALPSAQEQGEMVLYHNERHKRVAVGDVSQALALINSALGGGDSVQKYFHSVLASRISVKIPIQDKNELLSLMGILKVDVMCVDRVTAIERAQEASPMWKFLMFSGATDTVVESIDVLRYWRELTQLNEGVRIYQL